MEFIAKVIKIIKNLTVFTALVGAFTFAFFYDIIHIWLIHFGVL